MQVAPGLAQLRECVASLDARMVEAVGVDLRRMQEEHAKALRAASALAAEAAVGRGLGAEIRQLQAESETRAEAAGRLQAELAGREAQLAAMREEQAGREAQLAAVQADLAVRESELATAQGELVARDSQVARLRSELAGQHALFQQVRASHSWRLTRPLRVVGRILRGEPPGEGLPTLPGWLALRLASLPFLPRAFRARKLLEGHGSLRVVRDAEGAGQAVEAAPVAPELAPPGDKPDVLVWAVIDWHFRTQRPQHIARGLAQAGHRVFYVSNNLVDAAEPGFRAEPLDDSGRLYQVFLHAEGAPAIYFGAPTPQTVAQLRHSTGELLEWCDAGDALCIVQHPFWTDVASRVPGAALLYDCMDHHAGFGDNAPDVLAAEAELARSADLVLVTSDWLDHELAALNPNRAIVRNACDFAHFNDPPGTRYAPARAGKVIGYYGAIAEWFDIELVRGIARAFPDCTVLLVGNDTAGAATHLSGESNVEFTGEVPYDRLPHYLYAFDVALLPFQVIPLTLATNPVKVYEYLSAGKPVVAVDLPEMRQFGDLVRCAPDRDAFLAAVADALREDDPALVGRRVAFAKEQTWLHRAEELDCALATLRQPMASVVVLTYNNLDFTRACLHSIEALSRWDNLEVIVVDNASTDGTREFLREWETRGPGRRAILNDANLGFAAGNNVGLAAARGDYLVLLNNDTYVTPGWIGTMVRHLARNPDIGILGPVTNNIGNEARIEIHYADMAEMQRRSAAYTRRHLGSLFDIQTVAFFCVAMPRSTLERVGMLDEAFGIGFFEDDDYCRRVEAAGLRVVCADDVFVHHHLSASFDALKAERKRELFERNKAIYEAKWGAWTPHAYRPH
jgi:GT2 family glycosyltransferase/glycosyltransferase involved in cell wall biosynthesis